jgi:hypothetical protein
MALLDDEGKLAAATRNGKILYGEPAGLSPFPYNFSFTGAFALWKHPDTGNKLFLVGIRGSSSAYGYREIPLLPPDPNQPGSDRSLGTTLQVPGDGAAGGTTVSNTAKYNSSLEKQALNSILMAPKEVSTEGTGKYPVIFASTQKNGLWVYRDGSWNAQN